MLKVFVVAFFYFRFFLVAIHPNVFVRCLDLYICMCWCKDIDVVAFFTKQSKKKIKRRRKRQTNTSKWNVHIFHLNFNIDMNTEHEQQRKYLYHFCFVTFIVFILSMYNTTYFICLSHFDTCRYQFAVGIPHNNFSVAFCSFCHFIFVLLGIEIAKMYIYTENALRLHFLRINHTMRHFISFLFNRNEVIAFISYAHCRIYNSHSMSLKWRNVFLESMWCAYFIVFHQQLLQQQHILYIIHCKWKQALAVKKFKTYLRKHGCVKYVCNNDNLIC